MYWHPKAFPMNSLGEPDLLGPKTFHQSSPDLDTVFDEFNFGSGSVRIIYDEDSWTESSVINKPFSTNKVQFVPKINVFYVEKVPTFGP